MPSETASVAGVSPLDEDVTADDFLTGLLAGLATQHVETVSLRGQALYEAFKLSFDYLSARAADYHLDLRFRVFLDPVYGDSPVVRDAISSAVQRDLVSLDNPEYQDMRLTISPAVAEDLLENVPGGKQIYMELGRAFLEKYPWVTRRMAR